MISSLARLVFYATVPCGAALLVRGYVDTGDGFTAGIVVGVGAVAASVSARDDRGRRTWGRLAGASLARSAMIIGLAIVVITALAPSLFGLPPVSHFPAPDAHVTKLGSLELHTAVLFDFGIAVLVFGAVVEAFEHLRLAGHEHDPEDEERGA